MLEWLKMIAAGDFQQYDKVLELELKLRNISSIQWYHDDFHKWTWWLNVALSIIPWIIWWKVADRKRILEILCYGFLVALLSSFLDVIGSELVLWGYPDRLLPNIPRLIPFDYTIVPVVYMLIYQYYPSWRGFITANIIMSAIAAFIMEPLLIKIEFYTLVTWKHVYSFPIYVAIAIISRWAVERVRARQV